MDYIMLDADGKIAEVTIWWRPLPSGVQMQGHLAGLLGMQPWELLTDMETRQGKNAVSDASDLPGCFSALQTKQR
jgi:hypothetical protein